MINEKIPRLLVACIMSTLGSYAPSKTFEPLTSTMINPIFTNGLCTPPKGDIFVKFFIFTCLFHIIIYVCK